MKKLIAICIAISISLASIAGGLQFNQVKLVSTVETVPAGHVWKVVNVLPSNVYQYTGTSAAVTHPGFEILVDGNARFCGHPVYQNVTSADNQYAPAEMFGPFWLPAGTTLAASTNVGEISVVEFVVTP